MNPPYSCSRAERSEAHPCNQFKMPSPAKVPLAPEIWDLVVKDVPSFSARTAARVFGFMLGNQKQEKHGRVWESVFRDQAWAVKAREAGLNPTLIGPKLKTYYHRGTDDSAYLCIWSNSKHGDAGEFLSKNKTLFFKCLQPHSYHESSQEVRLKNGITLNTSNIFETDTTRVNVDPRRVLLYRSRGFRTYYILWEDKTYGLREVGSHSGRGDITDQVDLSPTNLSSMSLKCLVRIHDPEGQSRRVALHNVAEIKRHDDEFEASIQGFREAKARYKEALKRARE